MEIMTNAINVQVDTRDKEEATSILKDLDISMSTFVNILENKSRNYVDSA